MNLNITETRTNILIIMLVVRKPIQFVCTATKVVYQNIVHILHQ